MKPVREDDITPIELSQIYIRRSRIFWVIVGACLAIAIVVCIVSTRLYEATGTIQVGKESSDALSLGNEIGGKGENDEGDAVQARLSIETQASILQSDTLALETVNDLRLESTYDFIPRFSLIGWLGSLMSPSAPHDPANASLEESPQRRRQVLKIFRKHLKVKSIPGTRLIEVSYLSSDPKVAAGVVNKLAEALVDYNFQTRFKATEKATNWLAAQMEGLRKNSEALQAEVAQMQRDSGVYSIGTTDAAGKEQAYSGILDRLQQDTVALTSATENRLLKGAVYKAVQSGDAELLSGLAGNSLSTGMSQGTNNSLTVIQTLRTQQATLNAQIQQDQVKFGSEFPRLAEEQANLAGLKQAIQEESKRLSERAKSDYDIALTTENDTRKEYETQRAAADKLNDKAIKFVIVSGEAANSRSLYEDLSKHLEEAGVLQGLQSTNITIVDKGRIPGLPKWPNIPLYLAAGLGFGVCFGGVVAFLTDRLSEKIQQPKELERLSVPLCGVLPKFKRQKGAEEESPLLADPNSLYCESIRALCSSLMLSDSSRQPKSILVTSAIPSEGKSTLSENLAISFAMQGKSVLLVKADMRRARPPEHSGKSDGGDLSAFLLNDSSNMVPPKHPDLPNLSLLRDGEVPYPSELLASPRMKELMTEWRQKYDVVVLDGPPVLPLIDALILCKMVDCTILVVRHNFSSLTSVKRALDRLAQKSERTILMVLNAVSSPSSVYQGYYGYNPSAAPKRLKGARVTRLLGCIAMLCALTLTASGQQESLLIGPGDQLSVQVVDTPELSQRARVTDAGELPLAMGGNVKVSSLTPAQAASAIAEALVKGHVLNHPHVSVIVDQYATQSISILGEVRTPGLFAISTPRSVIDALAMAGGLTQLADRTITIERRFSQERVTYNLSNSANAALDQKVLVYPGDRILVSKVGVVYVLGDVGRPGGYPMATNDSTISVLQAIAMASGANHSAVPSHSRLIKKTDHGYEESQLPLSDMQKGKVPDVLLSAGDIIYVPFSYLRNLAVNGSAIIADAGAAAIYHY